MPSFLPSSFFSFIAENSAPEASCPTVRDHRQTSVAGLSTNGSFLCLSGSNQLLPIVSINDRIYNSRSLNGNYSIIGISLVMHRFGMSMNGDCINCITLPTSGFEPERVSRNFALTVVDCDPSWSFCNPPPAPLKYWQANTPELSSVWCK